MNKILKNSFLISLVLSSCYLESSNSIATLLFNRHIDKINTLSVVSRKCTDGTNFITNVSNVLETDLKEFASRLNNTKIKSSKKEDMFSEISYSGINNEILIKSESEERIINKINRNCFVYGETLYEINNEKSIFDANLYTHEYFTFTKGIGSTLAWNNERISFDFGFNNLRFETTNFPNEINLSYENVYSWLNNGLSIFLVDAKTFGVLGADSPTIYEIIEDKSFDLLVQNTKNTIGELVDLSLLIGDEIFRFVFSMNQAISLEEITFYLLNKLTDDDYLKLKKYLDESLNKTEGLYVFDKSLSYRFEK